MTRAIVFDAFGTLFHKPGTTAHRYALTRLGSRQYRKLITLSQISGEESEKTFGGLISKDPDLPFDGKEYLALLQDDLAFVRYFDRTVMLLKCLRKAGYVIGLVSNLSRPYQEKLYQLGITELIDEWAFSCDIGTLKPDIRIFGAIQVKLQQPAQRILMVGDNAAQDIVGAKHAGFNTLLLEYPPTNIVAMLLLLKKITAHFKQIQ